jgi:hypothetical protein
VWQFAHLDEEIVHIGPANVGVFDDASLLKVDADLDKVGLVDDGIVLIWLT